MRALSRWWIRSPIWAIDLKAATRCATMNLKFPPIRASSEKGVRELEFWQNTEATIVAIKSGGRINLSPGPNAVFHPYDILVVAGNLIQWIRSNN